MNSSAPGAPTPALVLRLDHLRYLSMFLVIIWHYIHLPGMVPFNYVPGNIVAGFLEESHTCVAMFITISGFIFEYLCYNKEIIYSRFIYNRVLRIFPLFLVFSLLATYISGSFKPEDVVFNMLTLLNPTGLPSVGWTVAVEFQFYFIFPFLHVFLKKKGPGYLALLILFFILLRAITNYGGHPVQHIAHFTMFGRMDQFLMGMIAAWCYKKYLLPKFSTMRLSTRYLLSGGTILYVIIVMLFAYQYFNETGGFYDRGGYPSKSPIWIWWPTFDAVCHGMLILGYLLFPANGLNTYDKLFFKLARPTYSMYWLHFPIIYALVNMGLKSADFPTALLYAAFVVTPVTTVISFMGYYLIEKPFLDKKQAYLKTSVETVAPTSDPPAATAL